MNLQAKYNPQQDRIRLTLQPANGEPRAFWVTRRQWLSLLPAVAGSEEAKVLPRAKKPLPAAATPLLEAMPLLAIRLRRLAEGVMRIEFVADTESMAITLHGDGLAQLKQMLLQQAERADWDAAAALARFNAQGMARAAMRKASRGPDQR